jgi:plastocyanin
MRASRWSVIVALCLLIAPGSHAGQRRVDVGFGGTNFAPSTQTLNQGDQLTFVWAAGAGTHTATSGTDPSGPDAGLVFDSGFLFANPSAFTWKADRTGDVPFFCNPHFFSGMIGTLQISPPGTVAVSSFRITEVQYNEAAGHDRIEIANLGGDVGDLGRYRISINGTSSVVLPLNTATVLSGTSPGRVVIHTNEGTTGSTSNNMFIAVGDLPTTGSIALYAPNTKSGTSLADATQIVDFVQWGAGNQAMAATAVAAGVWLDAAEFVDPVPVTGGYDLVFCGTESDRGKSFWNVAHPNFRTQSLCATPTQASTWGRIKLLYR